MRTTKGREESRVADAAGPRLFRAKTVRPAPPGAPQRAGFGLGPPALFSAQAGENRAPGGATGPFFRRRRKKNPGEAFLGARLEMPVSLTRRARGFFAPKQFARRPRAPPSAPGSAWVRRRCFRPKPAKIGLLGARLGRFFGAGAKKILGRPSWGRGWRCS